LLSDAGLYENPLVPNKKLLQMYGAMADARALDEHISRLQKRMKPRRRLDSTRGQEACRVSTALELLPGDLVSDSQPGVVMDLLSGDKVRSLLQRMAEFHAGKIDAAKLVKSGSLARQLPWIEETTDRLNMAMGAALSFKTLKRGSVVVAYVRHSQLDKKEWRRTLELTSRLELPIIFVVLPRDPEKKDEIKNLCAKARSWGMPGIPVDASDAVALYRVTQESLGRIRADGGPVLIECITYHLKDSTDHDGVVDDPLLQMKGFLLSRKVCTKAWLKQTGERLIKRISASE
jgi:acetoin:2,6-dichlorophenolindophenol oxidoreductase subunit alpha